MSSSLCNILLLIVYFVTCRARDEPSKEHVERYWFFTKVNARVIRPGLSQLFDGCPNAPNRPLTAAMRQLDRACEQLFAEAKLAA
jgi:hypothetical protein